MSEFSDRPLVAGSLFGLRAFAVDSLGRLKGPAYGGIFKPGDNEAECLKRDPDDLYASMMGMSRADVRRIFGPPASVTFHPVPSDPSPASGSHPRFGGRLRAAFEDTSKQVEAATKSLSEEAVEPKPLPKHNLAGLGCTCGYYAYFNGRNDYKDSERVTAIIEGFGVCTVGTDGFRASKARLVAMVQPGNGMDPIRAGLIARNYPDVPMYARKRDALAAHPLTTDHIPTPETVEDFWTREAK